MLIEGLVKNVCFTPGSGSVTFSVATAVADAPYAEFFLLTDSEELEVVIDGEHVVKPHSYVSKFDAALGWLQTTPCRVKAEASKGLTAVKVELTRVGE